MNGFALAYFVHLNALKRSRSRNIYHIHISYLLEKSMFGHKREGEWRKMYGEEFKMTVNCDR